MSEILITARGLTKTYNYVPALNNIDLTVESGRIVGLLGPNGSGKTTLIKLICGLLQPTSGILTVGGQPIGTQTKSMISYLPDRMYIADWFKACDLVDFFADFYQDFDRQKAVEMLSALSISPQDKIKTMSKGTKEKIQLAMIMSRNAKLYLLDEPIAGVDPAARDFILNTIITNYNENGTVIISTHLISDIETILDEAIFIQNGNIVKHDTVDNIREMEGKSVDQLFREIFAYGK